MSETKIEFTKAELSEILNCLLYIEQIPRKARKVIFLDKAGWARLRRSAISKLCLKVHGKSCEELAEMEAKGESIS